MPRTRSAYPSEFRHQMVELVRSGRSATELARDFEGCAETIRKWVRQADLDEGRRLQNVKDSFLSPTIASSAHKCFWPGR